MASTENTKTKKRDRSVIPWLAAAMVIILFFFILLGAGILNSMLFKGFIKDLQADVDFARNGGSMEFMHNGEMQDASYHVPDAILYALSEAGAGKRGKASSLAEQMEASIENGALGSSFTGAMKVSFGNGHSITVYETIIRDGDGGTNPGVLVAYSKDGKTYAYDTNKLIFSKIVSYINQFEQ